MGRCSLHETERAPWRGSCKRKGCLCVDSRLGLWSSVRSCRRFHWRSWKVPEGGYIHFPWSKPYHHPCRYGWCGPKEMDVRRQEAFFVLRYGHCLCPGSGEHAACVPYEHAERKGVFPSRGECGASNDCNQWSCRSALNARSLDPLWGFQAQ